MNTEYNKSTIKLKKLEKEMFSNIEKMGGGGGEIRSETIL